MLVDLDIDAIASATQQEIDAGTDPQTIMKALTDGMNEVGSRYEQGEYFLTELVLAGETMKESFTILKPHLTVEEAGERKPVIIATVKGDNHDIGKNILGTMLMSAGFEVIDLGIDVSKETIVDTVKEHNVKVVALSCLLTMTINEISQVNNALKEAGLRDKVKLVVGGAPLSLELAKELGADDYGADAIDGVKRIGALLEG
ncbi:MAG: cobalamin-dependent protein [Candidatus Thorarchaeota archaeon]|nr:cobalamin-dependent protein [Candidatus Thorarchaeota archaeon]